MRAPLFFLIVVPILIGCRQNNQKPIHAPASDSTRFIKSIKGSAPDNLKPRVDSFLIDYGTNSLADSALADKCHNFGRELDAQGQFALANVCFQEALRLRLAYYHGDDLQQDVLRARCMIGVTYNEQKKFNEALNYLKGLDDVWPTALAFRRPYVLLNTGEAYLGIYELKKALEVFQKVYSIMPKDDLDRPKLLSLFASCARQSEQFKLALNLAAEGIALANTEALKAHFEAISANIFQDMMLKCTTTASKKSTGQQALGHIHAAMNLYKKTGNIEGVLLTASNFGELYRRAGQPEMAISLIQSALSDSFNSASSQQTYAMMHINLGEAFFDLKKPDLALAEYNTALMSMVSGEIMGTLRPDIIPTIHWPNGLYTYGNIAKTQLYLLSVLGQQGARQKAVDAFSAMTQLTKLIRSELVTDDSKFDLAAQSQEALSNAVGVCRQLYEVTEKDQKDQKEDYKTKAFSFAEQSKGFALVEAVRLRQLGAANSDQKQRQASALRETLVSEFQKGLLEKDQGLLSYFVQDTILNIFLIRPDTMIWQQSITPKDSLNLWATKFQYLLQDPNAQEEQERKRLGYQLYQLLLAPLKGSLPPRLVIIPCAPFLGLPFEALSEHPYVAHAEKAMIDTNFVLFHHFISYAVSANIWAEMQKAPHATGLSNTVAAFVPSFNVSTDTAELAGILAPMNNTKFEVEGIVQKVPALTFSGPMANKAAFIDASQRFNILHIASHSICDDRNPDKSLLAFNQSGPTLDTGQLLYLRELYGLDLHQDLIVLSACETSRGEFALGEGNLSFARGLAHAGAHSFVSTLWVINTEPGTVIMPAFYEYLKQGLPKDIALTKAKQMYIRQSFQKNGAPLKWAGFVLNGSTQPIRFSDNNCLGYWPLILLALIGLLLFWWARKRNQRK